MRILVPVDGSASAGRAAALALRLAGPGGDGEVVLLNVQNISTLDTSDVSSVMSVGADSRLAVERSQKALGAALELCRYAPVKHSTRTAFGPIAETIVRIADEMAADQIVMGTRNFGPLRGAVLGSVSTKVLHAARMPVTLVK